METQDHTENVQQKTPKLTLHPEVNCSAPDNLCVPPTFYSGYKKTERESFAAQKNDGIFAIACLFLAYYFVRWGAPWYSGWGVSVFCLLFVFGVGLYAMVKGIQPAKESWYWLGITLLVGLSYSLWPGGWLTVPRGLLLAGAAIYWCGTLFGVLLRGKTSNFLPLDALNLTLLMPLRNYDAHGRTLRGLVAGGKKKGQLLRAALPGLVGLGLCLPVLGIILPLLAGADVGNFSRMYLGLLDFLNNFSLWHIMPHILPWVAALPVGVYLYWMLCGAAHKRYAKNMDPDSVRKNLSAMALVPQSTVWVVLGVVSAVYVLFVACQVPYFFSGFSGVKPEGYSLYSEYARQGFFELCRIAAINLGLMALANGFCRVSARQSKILRFLNLALGALTMLLIATAFSKMLLYIAVYGLTPKRVCTCVFMLFLAGVWVAVMVLQFKSFSIVRFAALYGAGLLCALCLCNLDGQIARYNTAHYAREGIRQYADLIAWRGGVAGAADTIHLYNSLDAEVDSEVTLRLVYVLRTMQSEAEMYDHFLHRTGSTRDTLTHTRARALDWPDLSEAGEGKSLFNLHYGDPSGQADS